jgi:hypothetical protein
LIDFQLPMRMDRILHGRGGGHDGGDRDVHGDGAIIRTFQEEMC